MKKPQYAITTVFNGTFDEAIKSITKALKQQGFGILTQIDVKATLKKKLDVDYPSYVILGACNPPNAYKALQAEKEIGLLLPCNVIVYEESGKVIIAIMKPTSALTLSDNSKVAEIATRVEEKLKSALQQVIDPKRSTK